MSYIKSGDLVCDWCFRVVYKKEEMTEDLRGIHTGWTRCNKCVDRKLPMKDYGDIKDLPIDFYAPIDPMRQWLRNIKYIKKI